jgi:VWFA-related protein
MWRGIPLVFLLSGAGPLIGQETVPGAGTDVVRLDVVVTDAQGKLVRSLTREDFDLREDGKPQRLTHFAVFARQASPTAPDEPASAEASPAAPTAPAGPAPAAGVSSVSRTVAIIVDDLHIGRSNVEFAKQALARLVDEFLLPDDNVALATTSGAVFVRRFTRDRAPLKAAIARLSFREAEVGPSRGSQLTPAQAEMILAGDLNALRVAASAVLGEAGNVFENSSPSAALNSNPGVSIPETDAERGAQEQVKRQARGVLLEALHYSGASLLAVADIIRSLAAVPGRKICLLLSDGFLVGARTSEERTTDLRSIIDAATRSGAVVYSLETRGLVTGTDAGAVSRNVQPAGLQEGVQRQTDLLHRNTLKTLADDTGGFLVSGTNDLAQGLRQMLEDNEAYYLIAYEPTNTKRDGRFRKIELRVPGHKDYTVRTRKGYLAPDDKKLAQVAQAPAVPQRAPAAVAPAGPSPADAIALLRAPVPQGGIPLRLTADYLDLPPVGSHAVVRAHVDPAGLEWKKTDGRERATLDLVGGVFDADGNPVGSPFGRRSDLDLTPAERKTMMDTGLHFQEQVPLPPGRYEVRLVARSVEGDGLGGARGWVEIGDLGQKKLAMSGVFLSSSGATAGSTPISEGGASSFRDVHASRRFKQGDGLFFQLYVYNPAFDEGGKSDVVIQAQILAAKKPLAASKPQPAVLQDKEGVPLPQANGMSLEGMAPGPYTLRIVVVDRRANATIFRDVDFTVE